VRVVDAKSRVVLGLRGVLVKLFLLVGLLSESHVLVTPRAYTACLLISGRLVKLFEFILLTGQVLNLVLQLHRGIIVLLVARLGPSLLLLK
jgi:hypothetical protein